MQKRTVFLFVLVCASLGALLVRTAQIGRSLSAEAVQSAHVRTLTLGVSRGEIYDCALKRLVDTEEIYLAAVAPSEAGRAELEAVFGSEKTNEMLQAGTPCLQKTDTIVQNGFMRTFAVPIRSNENTPAAHLIGSVNAAGQGESGIEKAFEDFLTQNGGSLRVRFEVDAAGRSLPGMKKEISDTNYRSRAGVVLTIDREIQSLTEQALRGSAIQSGCALVMEADSGAIRAMASVPKADETSDSALSPYRNKALAAYSVGSVFKPLLAAFALEQGISASFSCRCEGQCRVGDTVFRCYGGRAHGEETMQQALENSCNIYFIRLMEQIDVCAFLSFCRSIGLKEAVSICKGLFSETGSLPDETDLLLPGERANFAFGQGKLLLTPLHLLSIYQILATGKLAFPFVHAGYLDANGRFERAASESGRRILSEETARTMRTLLCASAQRMQNSKAKSEKISLAGKTGTAQSGIWQNGKEICRTWFCGYATAENPKWIVAVLDEDGVSGNADCAPVFRAICEGLRETVY